MTTRHPLIKTTKLGYQNASALMLEMKEDGKEDWSKLKEAEPYERNREVSRERQIQQLEKCRDGWISTGGLKYQRAQYRIGEYKYFPELGGYAFVEVANEPVPTRSITGGDYA